MQENREVSWVKSRTKRWTGRYLFVWEIVGRKLMKAVQGFYVDSSACVWVGNKESEWFLVNVGLRQAL